MRSIDKYLSDLHLCECAVQMVADHAAKCAAELRGIPDHHHRDLLIEDLNETVRKYLRVVRALGLD